MSSTKILDTNHARVASRAERAARQLTAVTYLVRQRGPATIVLDAETLRGMSSADILRALRWDD